MPRSCAYEAAVPDARERWARIGLVVLNVAIFLGIWEIVAEQEWINPLFFPAPSATYHALIDGFSDGTLGAALLWSLRCFAIGMIAPRSWASLSGC